MTDIDLKRMMFEEKMAAIEEDVPPFGMIDDGTDYMNEIESRETDGWHHMDNIDVFDEDWS